MSVESRVEVAPLERSSALSSLYQAAHGWFYDKLLSPDNVERHFAALIMGLCTSALLFIVVKTEGPFYTWGSPLCNIWSVSLLLATLLNYAYEREHGAVFELTRLVQFVLCMLSVLIFYDGSNTINRYRYSIRGDAMLYDADLLRLDEFLLGWLYPRGQLALYLDTQPLFGATTVFAHWCHELLQILYISYYFWGNAIGVIMAAQYFYYSVYKKIRGTKKKMQWRRLQMFMCAWVGGFVLNHLINLCFPAASPRIYLRDSYVNEIRGIWVLHGLRSAVTNAAANTFSAFPSGHCGLSILAVILAHRVNLSKKYTFVVGVTTVLIVLATQVLRYHYFVDFLFSLPIVAFSVWFGNLYPASYYEHQLICAGLEEYDEDGKKSVSPRSADQQPLLPTNHVTLEMTERTTDSNKLNPTTTPIVRSSSLGGLAKIEQERESIV